LKVHHKRDEELLERVYQLESTSSAWIKILLCLENLLLVNFTELFEMASFSGKVARFCAKVARLSQAVSHIDYTQKFMSFKQKTSGET